jgi:hypothetical protein
MPSLFESSWHLERLLAFPWHSGGPRRLMLGCRPVVFMVDVPPQDALRPRAPLAGRAIHCYRAGIVLRDALRSDDGSPYGQSGTGLNRCLRGAWRSRTKWLVYVRY